MKDSNAALPVSMGTLLRADLPEDAAHRDDGLCVVGVLGKSGARPGPQKETLLNDLADKHVFSLFGGPRDGGTPDSHIRAFHLRESRVLYLLLSSVGDGRQLLRACESLSAGTGHSDAHDVWTRLDRQHCLHLLYVFSVCHVLLLVHPNQTFDVTHDRLFRALDALRQKVLPLMRAAVKDCAVSKEWKLNCRPCPPRLLFVFQMSGSLKVRVGATPETHGHAVRHESTRVEIPQSRSSVHSVHTCISKVLIVQEYSLLLLLLLLYMHFSTRW